MRSDSQGSGRRGSRDNVSTRVSGEIDWSDVAAADVRFPRPELPKKEVPGAKVALVVPVDRVRRGWLSTSPLGKGPSAQKKEAVASFSSMDCFLPSIYRPTILLPSRKAGFLRRSG